MWTPRASASRTPVSRSPISPPLSTATSPRVPWWEPPRAVKPSPGRSSPSTSATGLRRYRRRFWCGAGRLVGQIAVALAVATALARRRGRRFSRFPDCRRSPCRCSGRHRRPNHLASRRLTSQKRCGRPAAYRFCSRYTCPSRTRTLPARRGPQHHYRPRCWSIARFKATGFLDLIFRSVLPPIPVHDVRALLDQSARLHAAYWDQPVLSRTCHWLLVKVAAAQQHQATLAVPREETRCGLEDFDGRL